MAIASKQIQVGIHNPSKVVGNDTLEMTPKKADPLLQPDRYLLRIFNIHWVITPTASL